MSRQVAQPVPIDMYLDLLKRMLTRLGFEDENSLDPIYPNTARSRFIAQINRLLRPSRMQFGLMHSRTLTDRIEGMDWPRDAETMIGLKRLDQLHDACESVRVEGIQGDFMETGVWRGGAAIFMTAFSRVHGMNRMVFAADSFEGLPLPDPRYPVDEGDKHHELAVARASLEEVQANFRKYGLPLDDVVFLPGWFEDTMPTAPVDRLAILRLDGDMYSSTIQVLEAMFDKVSPGGFVIVDDYYLTGARTAVHDFLSARNLEPIIEPIDMAGAYWRVN